MKKLVILFGLLILLAVTNPEKADFVSWFEQQTIEQSDGLLEKGLSYLLAEELTDSLTETNNYGVFSTYTLPTDGEGSMNFIGVFGNFIPIGNIEINLDYVVGFFGMILIALVVLRVLRKLLAKDEEELEG